MQEALSRAYVRAVAARAGMICQSIEPDFGFDLFLRTVERHDREYWDSGPQLDIQAKSTIRAEVRESEIAYDLEVRAYNLLRRTNRPCILVLLVLPADEGLWLTQSEDELILRYCAYWMSLQGAAAKANEVSVRVTIPRTNVFSVESVNELMRQLEGTSP
jgi:hypothetical protein